VALPIGEHNIDGLLVFSNSVDDHLLLYLHERQFPTILLYRTAPSFAPLPAVGINNHQGAYRAVEHLLTHCGRHRIAFLRGPAGSDDSREREAGYRAALQVHGVAVDETLLGIGNFATPTAETTVQQWLAEGYAFDAIFAGDDNAAVGAISALQRAGLRVPEDVAVVGFNDDPLDHVGVPPLTTVRAPTVRVGYTAIHLLVELLQGRHVAATTQLPTALVVRQSCGYHTDAFCC
jgi:DNA-binding LacI/PurR family transcriptional regulator